MSILQLAISKNVSKSASAHNTLSPLQPSAIGVAMNAGEHAASQPKQPHSAHQSTRRSHTNKSQKKASTSSSGFVIGIDASRHFGDELDNDTADLSRWLPDDADDAADGGGGAGRCCFGYLPVQKSAVLLAILLIVLFGALALTEVLFEFVNARWIVFVQRAVDVVCLILVLSAHRTKNASFYLPFLITKGFTIAVYGYLSTVSLFTALLYNEKADQEMLLFLVQVIAVWLYSVFVRSWLSLRRTCVDEEEKPRRAYFNFV